MKKFIAGAIYILTASTSFSQILLETQHGKECDLTVVSSDSSTSLILNVKGTASTILLNKDVLKKIESTETFENELVIDEVKGPPLKRISLGRASSNGLLYALSLQQSDLTGELLTETSVLLKASFSKSLNKSVFSPYAIFINEVSCSLK